MGVRETPKTEGPVADVNRKKVTLCESQGLSRRSLGSDMEKGCSMGDGVYLP